MTTNAYLRVSTDDQDNGIDAQRAEILKHCTPDRWFEERASGKNVIDRPVFREAIRATCDVKGTLVVAKLDRLGRSVVDVLNVFADVKECGASIKVLDMGIDTTTPVGELMLTLLASFAQFERKMIGQRTKDGLAAARANGVTLGRPRTYNHGIIRNKLAAGETVEQIAKALGCSVRTVRRAVTS